MKYSERDRKRARRLREQGLGVKPIARKMKIPETTIRRWVVPGYIERHRQNALAWKRRQTGECVDCGATTKIQQYVSEPSLRCVTCAGIANRLYDHERMIELRKQGLTQREIAQLVGCTQANVATVLCQAGMRVGHGSGPGRGAKLT